MSLRDMLKPTIQPYANNIKAAEINRIAEQTKEFERRGGKVTEIENGKSALDGGVLLFPECKGGTPITVNSKDLLKKSKRGGAANKRVTLPLHVNRSTLNKKG